MAAPTAAEVRRSRVQSLRFTARIVRRPEPPGGPPKGVAALSKDQCECFEDVDRIVDPTARRVRAISVRTVLRAGKRDLTTIVSEDTGGFSFLGRNPALNAHRGPDSGQKWRRRESNPRKISNGVFVESRDGYRISLQIAGPAL
jgi:hypothetical protein